MVWAGGCPAFSRGQLWGRPVLSACARLEIHLAVSLLARARRWWWTVETVVISLMLPPLYLFVYLSAPSINQAIWHCREFMWNKTSGSAMKSMTDQEELPFVGSSALVSGLFASQWGEDPLVASCCICQYTHCCVYTFRCLAPQGVHSFASDPSEKIFWGKQ